MIVGVNEFVSDRREAIGTLYIDESAGERQLARLDDTRAPARPIACRTLPSSACRPARRASRILMPLLLDAVRAYATVGEMCDGLREVWGEYVEDPII